MAAELAFEPGDAVELLEPVPGNAEGLYYKQWPAGSVGCVIEVCSRPAEAYDVDIEDVYGDIIGRACGVKPWQLRFVAPDPDDDYWGI